MVSRFLHRMAMVTRLLLLMSLQLLRLSEVKEGTSLLIAPSKVWSDKLKQPDKFKLSKLGIPLISSLGELRPKLRIWTCLIPRLTKEGVKSFKLGK